jgi:hypothetical protein
MHLDGDWQGLHAGKRPAVEYRERHRTSLRNSMITVTRDGARTPTTDIELR